MIYDFINDATQVKQLVDIDYDNIVRPSFRIDTKLYGIQFSAVRMVNFESGTCFDIEIDVGPHRRCDIVLTVDSGPKCLFILL